MGAVAAVVAAGLLPTTAGAVDSRVANACTNDYLAHCSQHAPNSPGVRTCFRAVGKRLSAVCVAALVAAGEVPKSKIAGNKIAGNKAAGKSKGKSATASAR
jgi:hypothetical protein